MIYWRSCLIRIDLNLLCGLLLHVLALVSLNNHFRFVNSDITCGVNRCINFYLIVVKIIHELLKLAVWVIPLVIVMKMIWWIVFHSVVLRPSQIWRTLLLLLGLVCRLYERFRCGKTISGRIETNIDFIIGHGEIGEIHFDHVIAKTAFFGELINLIFVFLLEILNLLLHLFQRQVQFFIQFVQLSILICGFVVFLCDLIIFFFKYIYSLVKNLNRIFKSVCIWKPILLLELFHIAEIELWNRWRPIFWFWMFILYSLCKSIYRWVHQLIEINRILRIQNLMVINSSRLFKFFSILDCTSTTPKSVFKLSL